MTATHGADLGARLRSIRNQQQLSLADVQHRSDGEWKAVVVGAYERGDRAISVTRLSQLAAFYGVPMADLLPGPEEEDEPDGPERVTLDLTRLSDDDPDLAAVGRFADHVCRQRGDHNGRVLTLRGGDLETIALSVDSTPDDLRGTLTDAEALLRIDLRGGELPAPTPRDQLRTANRHASRSTNPAAR